MTKKQLIELLREDIPASNLLPEYKYAINRTKKEYVVIPSFKSGKWVVHPLPLLCADGCFRGGGDYGDDWPCAEMVGRWAYDVISVTNDRKEIKGYTKINPKFKEKY